jgi:hypothetical protein
MTIQAHASIAWDARMAFVAITHSITIFSASLLTAVDMFSLCTYLPNYFLLFIKGVPFCRG